MWFRCGLGWFVGGLGCFGVVWGVSTDRFARASLRALEVGDVRWQPVPVTNGPRINGEIVCVVCGQVLA